MTTFIVEHVEKGNLVFESVTGVEDIDLTMFKDIKTLWVCDTPEEIMAVETELRSKHERSSQPA